ncbi:hypothetical protein HOP51_06605 [Halomonas sp. MCCC 1A11036]|uniref:DUF985 domain-containing protein n=1 Tax=Billgrantia zhangzhouensis TaxID=2733481 RepID=A0ABS9ADI4_9GAMM|nr:hypothetical protein [Halomonas zhangzhouensis]MCE8019788.1 hypothetical protein [Halomonas zhangzhouensis]
MSDQLLSPKMLGYWTQDQLREAPDESGIFCVYRAARDPETNEMEVQELLYVGEHRSARYGLEHHPDCDEWHAFLQPGEELWCSVGLVGHANRERLAAAMINAHKPRFNNHSQYRDHFPFDETTVHVYGKKDKLQSIFTVEPGA